MMMKLLYDDVITRDWSSIPPLELFARKYFPCFLQKRDQPTDGRTDGRTDRPTDRPTDPLIEMRGRI